MKDTDISSLKNDAERIYQEYELRFASKPRATRQPQKLKSLIEGLEHIVEVIDEADGSAAVEAIAERAEESLDRYRDELEEIQRLRDGEEPFSKAAYLATWANLEFGRYFRHFAGENRATRNPVLLERIISELEQIDDQLAELEDGMGELGVSDDREAIADNLEMYRNEYDKILEAQRSGDKQERVSLLAHLANRQFSRYQDFYAGKPRPSRSTRLIEEIIDSLEEIGTRMEQLSEEGITTVQNRRNLDIVEEQLSVYREEKNKIEAMKADLTLDEHVNYLGQAANGVFEVYRDEFAGKSREDRDLEQLARLTEDLFEIAGELTGVLEDSDPTTNDIYGVVTDHLTMFQSEYEKIWRAKRDGQQQADG
jgi:hypothetical protein